MTTETRRGEALCDRIDARVTRNMVARYADTPQAEEQATRAVGDACDALWCFLDGCYREYVEVAA